MRPILFVIFVILAGFVGQQFLPWWAIAVIAAMLSFIFDIEAKVSFWAGFLAVALLWGGSAIFLSTLNEGVLSARIGSLLGNMPGFVLILITAIIGGVFGGLGALNGSFARQVMR